MSGTDPAKSRHLFRSSPKQNIFKIIVETGRYLNMKELFKASV